MSSFGFPKFRMVDCGSLGRNCISEFFGSIDATNSHKKLFIEEMSKIKKTNFFYIDETGHVNNSNPLFVYGCIKTDTPRLLEETLGNLKQELLENPILREFGKRVANSNFHATNDPFDVRTAVFSLLPYLNFRAYFTVLFKNGSYYEKLKSERRDHEIIESSLRRIIVPRITKNNLHINRFYVETLEVERKSLDKILNDIFTPYMNDFDLEYSIVNKDNPNTPIIDYISFVMNKILTPDEKGNVPDWASRAFNAIKNKIALVHFQNDDSFYSRLGDSKHQIELQNLMVKWRETKDK